MRSEKLAKAAFILRFNFSSCYFSISLQRFNFSSCYFSISLQSVCNSAVRLRRTVNSRVQLHFSCFVITLSPSLLHFHHAGIQEAEDRGQGGCPRTTQHRAAQPTRNALSANTLCVRYGKWLGVGSQLTAPSILKRLVSPWHLRLGGGVPISSHRN